MWDVPLAGVPGVGSSVENGVLLILAFVSLLIGAEVFTNGIEWVGNRLGVSESATGSILAAVGTALPETMIPVIAILQAQLGSGSQAAADEVGVGAILGAPFMLATIGMFMLGASTLYFRTRRSYDTNFHFKVASTRRDLGFFMVGYSLAFVAALIQSTLISTAIGVFLVLLYVAYVYRSLTTGELAEEGEIEDLLLGRLVDRGTAFFGSGSARADGGTGHRADPSTSLCLVQTLIALLIIVAGAHLFVGEVEFFATEVLNMPTAVLALLLAPLATELPEKFNSIIWISRDKDTLAIGNISGAMAFQGTLPVTLGILFTSWNLSLEWGTTGFLNGISAVLAIISAAILYSRARRIDSGQNEGIMSPHPFLIGGAFYVLFVGLLLYHVFVLGVSAAGGH
jgi:cation:H+ antiporter